MIDPLTGLPDSNTISTDSLKSINPINITQPVDTSASYLSSINNATSDLQGSLNTAQANVDQQNKQAIADSGSIANLQASLGGKVQDTANTYNTTGVTSAYNQLADLNAQATGLKNEASAIPIQIQNQSLGQGVTDRGAAPIETARLRENALKALSLGQQAAIASANYDKAKNYADQIITAKYAGIEADITAKKTNLDALDKYTLTPAQEKLKATQQALLTKQTQDIAEAKQTQKDLQNLSLSIAKNGAPTKVMDSITNAKSFNDAIIAASPYLQSAADKADTSYKIAQTAKIYSDIQQSAETAGSNLDPSQSLAYAQEYASTGKIPTGIPKGGFGKVSQWAKELPKQTGEIVSTATGVHPAQDSTYADALSSLSSVVKLAQDLKIQDKSRIGGLISGTLGAITGSEAQSKYLSTRGQIVDLLSRARSGAALTENEVKTYEDMLPGRFSETLGIGQNSDVKIQNFVDAITKDMTNKSNAKGWSIYGVTPIKLGDKEYKVGDIIKSGDQSGRINSDGSITLIQ